MNKRSPLNHFSVVLSVFKTLKTAQVRPSNVLDKFQTIRVSKFGPGVQVTVNTFKNQIEFSSLLMVLEEDIVEVASVVLL